MGTISFIAATGNTQDSTAGDAFTLLKPTGAQENDVLIAAVVMGDTVSTAGTLPTGWTQIGSDFTTTGGNDAALMLGYRVVQAGDPASWTDGATPTDADVTATITACYREAHPTTPIIGHNGAWGLNPTTQSSGTVNNTDAGAWAIGIAALIDNAESVFGRNAGDPTTQRDQTYGLDSGEYAGIQLWDSNGTVATGNRSFTTEETGSNDALFSGVIILKPDPNVRANAGNAAATGTANQSAPDVKVNAGNAPGTGVANDAVQLVGALAGSVAGSGTAHDAEVVLADTAGTSFLVYKQALSRAHYW